MSTVHSAVDPALGYYFQGMYALVVLLEEGDDDSTILVEGDDDLELVGSTRSLYQLNHTLAENPPSITIKSVQLWKSLRVWIEANDPAARLVLVTCARIGRDNPLERLEGNRRRKAIEPLLDALSREARRVQTEREVARREGDPLPYSDKAPGTKIFLELAKDQRQQLLSRCHIIAGSDRITEVCDRIASFFKGWVPPDIRESFLDQLLQWWDYRVCRSLMRELPRHIHRSEVYFKQVEILKSLESPVLPDSYSARSPDDPMAVIGPNMARQIEYVRGGPARKRRAAIAWWKARHQRELWLTRDLSLETRFVEFDDLIEERWRERFEPLADDLKVADAPTCEQTGRQLLDWSHLRARDEIRQQQFQFGPDYLVPGTFQQLAEELRIGWHRDWRQLTEDKDE